MSIERVPQNEEYWATLAGYPDQRLDQGWNFAVGSPELWHFRDQLLVPAGTVLDIGAGSWARESMQFANSGMNVIAFEPNIAKACTLRHLVKETGLPIIVRPESFKKTEVQAELIIMSETFNHVSNKQEAYELLEAAWDSLLPGGHLWIRVVGKAMSSYDELKFEATYDNNVRIIDDDVIAHMCGCSGEVRIEPSLYFDQLELSAYLAQKQARFLHHQILPAQWEHNIMYGEDWGYGDESEQWGFISLLVRKPEVIS